MKIFLFYLLLPAFILSQQDPLGPYVQAAAGVFPRIDADGDGLVSLLEVENYFLKYDNNSDGEVMPSEFDAYINTNPDPTILALLQRIGTALYAFFDATGDNDLTVEDFSYLFNMTDGNGDGQVDQTEFSNYWGKMFYTLDPTPTGSSDD